MLPVYKDVPEWARELGGNLSASAGDPHVGPQWLCAVGGSHPVSSDLGSYLNHSYLWLLINYI